MVGSPPVFQRLQAYRLPALKASKPSKPSQPLFKAAVCPALNPLNAPNALQGSAGKPYVQQQPGPPPPLIQQIPAVGSPPVFQRLQAYRLPASKLLNPLNPPSRSQDSPRPTVFKGVQGCRLPGLETP